MKVDESMTEYFIRSGIMFIYDVSSNQTHVAP